MAQALSGAHMLIVQAEALRLALVHAGARYRTLFAWLLTTARRMAEEDPSAAQRHAFQMDAAALSEFLREQLFFDAIGPQLATAVRVRAEAATHMLLAHVGSAHINAAILELVCPSCNARPPPALHCINRVMEAGR